jgi:hypothetical protein
MSSILSDIADTLHKGDAEVLKYKFCDGIIKRLKTRQKLTDDEIADMGKFTLTSHIYNIMYDIRLDELTHEFDYTPEELTIFMRECDACETIRCSDFVISFYVNFLSWVTSEVCKRFGKVEEEITNTYTGTVNSQNAWDSSFLNDIIGAISHPIKDSGSINSGSMFGGMYLETDNLEF